MLIHSFVNYEIIKRCSEAYSLSKRKEEEMIRLAKYPVCNIQRTETYYGIDIQQTRVMKHLRDINKQGMNTLEPEEKNKYIMKSYCR